MPQPMRVALAIAMVLVYGGTAAAQEAAPPDAGPEPTPAPEPEPEPDWESAPPADQASGVARPPSRGAKALLWIPRVIFFVPRWTLTLVAQPVRLGGWAYERYQLGDRFKQFFFNVDGTFGMYPVAFFETGFGLNFGARLVHKDLFGKNESLRLRAGFGGRFEQIYRATMSTGDRLGDRWRISLEGHYERRPEERFFGFGNHDASDPDDVMIPVDPLAGEFAIDSRFAHRVAKVELGVDVDLTDELTARLSSALALRRYEAPDGDRDDDITDLYNTDRLVGFNNTDSFLGFDNGVQNLYTELELRYDTRSRTDPYRTNAIPSSGWLLSGYGGYMAGIGDDPSGFIRYGADLQRYIDLYDGGRILALRVLVETTGGTDGKIDEIPFTDMPRLGGATLLRGYQADRFRDRAITLGSAEYIYDLVPQFSAYLFVDAGRVFRSLKNFEFEEFRVGYGAGIRAHSPASFLMRLDLSTSIDGGLFFNFSFSPVTSRRDRAGAF